MQHIHKYIQINKKIFFNCVILFGRPTCRIGHISYLHEFIKIMFVKTIDNFYILNITFAIIFQITL